jgi:hypothetical protein
MLLIMQRESHSHFPVRNGNRNRVFPIRTIHPALHSTALHRTQKPIEQKVSEIDDFRTLISHDPALCPNPLHFILEVMTDLQIKFLPNHQSNTTNRQNLTTLRAAHCALRTDQQRNAMDGNRGNKPESLKKTPADDNDRTAVADGATNSFPQRVRTYGRSLCQRRQKIRPKVRGKTPISTNATSTEWSDSVSHRSCDSIPGTFGDTRKTCGRSVLETETIRANSASVRLDSTGICR